MEYQTSSRNCLSKIKGQRSVEGQKYDRVPKMVLLRINDRIFGNDRNLTKSRIR